MHKETACLTVSDPTTARKREEISRELERISRRMERDREERRNPPIPVFRRDGDRFTVIVEDS